MHRSSVAFVALLLSLLAPGVWAQQELAALQGRWVVTGGEHNGKPMDAITGGVLTITGNAFEVRTASGNLLTGTLRVTASTTPVAIDLLHADGAHWEAIYAIDGDVLTLNYVEAGGKDPRPKTFTTSPTTEESIVRLQRQDR